METSWAGPAAVVLFVGWLAYFVPTRLSMRQQVVDGRVDDRFSGSLRVLAVANRSSGPRMMRASSGGGGTGGARPLRSTHTPASGVPLLSGGRPATGAVPVVRPNASRLQARRAVAARRRLVLALGLLVVCLAVVVVAAYGVLPWPVLLVPAVLLGGVVALGRRTVVAQRRADSARMDIARARVAEARRSALGGPVAPRNAARPRVTGLAVPSSQTATQMIPQVPAPRASAPGETSSHGSVPRSPVPGRSAEPTQADAARAPMSAGAPASLPSPPRPPVVVEQPPVARQDVPAARTSGEPWSPVPVPPPTYTLKPRAGRQDPQPAPMPLDPLPAPVPAEELAGLQAPGTLTARGVATDATSSTGPTSEAVAGSDAPDESGPVPATDTLGLSLGAILARRRASGE